MINRSTKLRSGLGEKTSWQGQHHSSVFVHGILSDAEPNFDSETHGQRLLEAVSLSVAIAAKIR